MALRIAERQQERGQLVQQMRDLQAMADTEKRSLTAEESATWDKIDAAQESLGVEIEKDQKREASLKAAESALKQTSDSGIRPAVDGALPKAGRDSDEYRSLYGRYLTNPQAVPHSLIEQRTGMQADVYQKGGVLLAPMTMVAGILKAIDNEVFLRALGTRHPCTYAGLGAVTLDAQADDFDWTTELAVGNETDISLGKRELKPHALAKLVKISNTAIRHAADIVGIVQERLAYKAGQTIESAGLTGTGFQQPLGLFTASANGIPTSRDVSTSNTSTAFTADGLMEAKYSLKSQYHARPSTRWIFHRTAIKKARQLKDGNGQYIWAPGLGGGQPDRILDVPFVMSELCPATFTTGLYVGLIGDLSYYWWADSLDMTIQVVDQLYAATNQTGYIARMEMDGQPVLAEAFARVKLA